jgi:hypothetical protein
MLAKHGPAAGLPGSFRVLVGHALEGVNIGPFETGQGFRLDN